MKHFLSSERRRRHLRRQCIATLAAVTIAATGAFGSRAATSKQSEPPAASVACAEYDVRAVAPIDRSVVSHGPRVDSKVPPSGLEVTWNPATGVPSSVTSPRGYLSEPDRGTPGEIAIRFVQDHASLLGFGEDDVKTLVEVAAYTSAPSGLAVVSFVQRVDGLPVVGTSLKAAVDGDGRLVWLAGEVYAGMVAAAGSASWNFEATEGAVLAAKALGRRGDDATVLEATRTGLSVDLGPEFRGPARVQASLFPLGPGRCRPAWTSSLVVRESGHAFVASVDAGTGRLLARSRVTYTLTSPDYAFTVFGADSPNRTSRLLQPRLPKSSVSRSDSPRSNARRRREAGSATAGRRQATTSSRKTMPECARRPAPRISSIHRCRFRSTAEHRTRPPPS
jgi:hypothetical protein